jgi:hypothetical protein
MYEDLLALSALALSGGQPHHELVSLLSTRCPLPKAERLLRSRRRLRDLYSVVAAVDGRTARESLTMNVSLLRLRLAIVEHRLFDRERCAVAARHVDRIIAMMPVGEVQPQALKVEL